VTASSALPALALKIALVAFMAGSLLGMGLDLRVREALTGLTDRRFALRVVALGFVWGPAVALALTRLLNLDPAYGAGLMLLALAPCAPFLSMVVERAEGDRARTAAHLLISSFGTILAMPVVVPWVIPGLSVDAWTITRPLLGMVFLPLAAGMLLLWSAPGLAARIRPAVKLVTRVFTVILLGLCAVIYGTGFLEAVGTRAIAAQAIFLAVLTASAHAWGRGFQSDHRNVLTLGQCTRNVGAALAPLLGISGVDPRTVVMVVLAVPLQLAIALPVARWLGGAGKRAG
jgi:BASS family bile acid:Na+ symporter